jgi:hypothetical protein
MDVKAIALLAGGLIAAGGVGSALADLDDGGRDDMFRELEVRKDDGSDDVELVDEEDDRGDGGGDNSRNGESRHDQPSQDPQTGSGHDTGPGTGQTAGTGWEGDTDGDMTGGNDGTSGGNNSYVAQPADYADDSGYVAPAPAPAADYSYDGGSGGSDG